MNLGQQIRGVRELRGLSQRDVADATGPDGISYAALSRIENGQRYPTVRTMEMLSRALKVRVVVENGTTNLYIKA